MIYILFSLPLWATSVYNCTSEFGETVLIEQTIDQKTTALNKHALDIVQKAKVKTRKMPKSNPKVEYKTRYLLQPGDSFEIHANCKESPCTGMIKHHDRSFGIGEKLTIRPKGPLFDKRDQYQGFATVQLGRREFFGLIVRVYKQSKSLNVSASGEYKWTGDLVQSVVHDTGVDEALYHDGDFIGRVAALELKLRCQLNTKESASAAKQNAQ